jgi:hypothetical protein
MLYGLRNIREKNLMKRLIVTLILAVGLSGCSGGTAKRSQNSTANAGPTPTITPQVEITPPIKTENREPASTTETASAPVEFTYMGLTPDKENISYKIRVNTAKEISQVDIAVRYLDAQGQVVTETTLAWQNIIKSRKQPIEQGRTYEVEDYLEPGSLKAECQLKRVFFTDGSTWSAK